MKRFYIFNLFITQTLFICFFIIYCFFSMNNLNIIEIFKCWTLKKFILKWTLSNVFFINIIYFFESINSILFCTMIVFFNNTSTIFEQQLNKTNLIIFYFIKKNFDQIYTIDWMTHWMLMINSKTKIMNDV